jgi:hypothetical protein
MLVSTVREIEETYELGAGSGDPKAMLIPDELTEKAYDRTMTDLAKQAAEQIEKWISGPNLNASARIADANRKLMAATKSLLTTPEGRAKVAAFGQVMEAAKKEAKKKRKTNG